MTGTISSAPPSTTSVGLMPWCASGALPMCPSIPARNWNTSTPRIMPIPAARKPYWLPKRAPMTEAQMIGAKNAPALMPM